MAICKECGDDVKGYPSGNGRRDYNCQCGRSWFITTTLANTEGYKPEDGEGIKPLDEMISDMTRQNERG